MSLFVRLQRALPKHLVSRALGKLASTEVPFVSAPLIHLFAKTYAVQMDEAEQPDLRAYRSFNDFFTRPLHATARQIDAAESTVVSPADGVISQVGRIEGGRLLQAKGIRYEFGELADVCAGPEFEGGSFVTIYLSPSDYHRVHIPLAGKLRRTVAVPGELFSVNALTEGEIEGLFARNERLVAEFETAAGKMLEVMVGALVVASIATVWPGPKSPYRVRRVDDYERDGIAFEKGAEIGHFLLGSTVILAFEAGRVELDPALEPGTPLRMGQGIGRVL
jgi:phosphatidylserine decarboxylase